MQQYLLESLHELQLHLSRSRQFFQVVDDNGDPHWQHVEPGEFHQMTHNMPLSSAKQLLLCRARAAVCFRWSVFSRNIT